MRAHLRARALALASAIIAFFALHGCASLCGDTGTRQGVFGLTLRCQSGAPVSPDGRTASAEETRRG